MGEFCCFSSFVLWTENFGSCCHRYIHDDSETTEDEVALRVTDGLNSAHVVLPIQVRSILCGTRKFNIY